ncbi:MAG TPA: VOC family protein [Sphingomonas sp.]|nr:VOC family protein [Sphingomonas sp.]
MPTAGKQKSWTQGATRRTMRAGLAPEGKMQTVIPHLWFAEKAEEACRFYVSLLPDSHINRATTIPAESPAGPAGSVAVIEFTLMGRPFMAIGAGPLDPFNHAVSFVIPCDTQAEIDRLWDALADGGQIEQCGWLRDRYGLCWQIVPARMGELMTDPDPARAARVAQAMLGMVKLDIAGLERAAEG